MRVSLISCWFMTSYGAYTNALRAALERQLGSEVGVIASNCGCGDPEEARGVFQDPRCTYVRFPHIHYWKSDNRLRYRLRNAARNLLYRQRAKHYHASAPAADVVHFQQTLNAYGSVAVFNWLRLPSRAARVVTVHEFDPYQLDFPKSNAAYNAADRIIVHSQEMKDRLRGYGVDLGRVDVIEHGVEIRPLPDGERAGILFYGGHKIHSGKGLDSLLGAMRIVEERLGERTPQLSIHGHWGDQTPEYGLQLVQESGLTSGVRWLNQMSLEDAYAEYQRAEVCVLPYTGSFAGFPAAAAMANGLPVIATRRAGLPDHLGTAAVWVEENDPRGLAKAILRVLEDDGLRRELARSGRERAERHLSWDAIAEKTIQSYEAALAHPA